MYSEIGFLFESYDTIKNKYALSSDLPKSTQAHDEKVEFDEDKNSFVVNNYVIKKEDNNNFIKSNINAPYDATSRNPYTKLLEDFEKGAASLKLNASDFVYLKEIGVHPLNRLMILRRFPEGASVPVDLNDLQGTKPISVVIGWVKEDNNLLDMSFNEKWIPHVERLDELIARMMNKEFGVDPTKIIPVPGWGEGMMFGLYKKLGLTDYSATELPIGDPDLLKESITRDIENQGLESTLSFKLETIYEQKYIGGIDQTVAYMNIINNLMKMGTSDMRFLGKPGNKFIQKIKEANNNPTNPQGWTDLIIMIFMSVIDMLKDTLTEFGEKVPEGVKPSGTNDKTPTKSGALIDTVKIMQSLLRTVLASTVARYQWPMRGAIGQMTGEAATPWHLTIGNPYAPLLSMNNINVKKVGIKLPNQMAVNDLSKTIEVTIDMEQGRNLGKQELYKLFGVEYQRKYKKL